MTRITLMAIRRRPSFILVLAILGLAAGCIDMTGPETEKGNYYLASVNGKPPKVVISDDKSERVEIVKGSLFLSSGGAITYSLSGLNMDKSDGITEEIEASATGVYTLDGNSLVATFDEGSYRIEMKIVTTYRETLITFTDADGGTSMAMVFRRINRGGQGSQMGVRG